MRLEKVTGPECPKCGCSDSVVIRSEVRWGKAQDRRRCQNCSSTWSAPAAEDLDDQVHAKQHQAVVYHVMRCPSSSGTRVLVTHTERPIRYHRCQDCRHRFKSVER